jgi:hypothetical protein
MLSTWYFFHDFKFLESDNQNEAVKEAEEMNLMMIKKVITILTLNFSFPFELQIKIYNRKTYDYGSESMCNSFFLFPFVTFSRFLRTGGSLHPRVGISINLFTLKGQKLFTHLF